jgi:hypothetical protein
MAITITGDNNYTGTYDDPMYVLGGANNGGHDDTDTGNGDEIFVFANLQYKNTKVTDTTYDGTGTHVADGTTWQTTADSTSNDTLHFGFTFHAAQPGNTSSYLIEGNIPHAFPDPDHDATSDIATTADDHAVAANYLDWVNSLTGGTFSNLTDAMNAAEQAGYTFSDSQTIETNALHNDSDMTTGHDPQPVPDTFWSGLVDATAPGTPASMTADHGGDKALLGFTVGSDHIALDGVTQDQFSQFFTVDNTATHLSANNNTVHDTVIALDGGSWSVDLYGVDLSAMSAHDAAAYVWQNVISHPSA